MRVPAMEDASREILPVLGLSGGAVRANGRDNLLPLGGEAFWPVQFPIHVPQFYDRNLLFGQFDQADAAIRLAFRGKRLAGGGQIHASQPAPAVGHKFHNGFIPSARDFVKNPWLNRSRMDGAHSGHGSQIIGGR